MAPKSARFVASASRPTTRASEKTGSRVWNPERGPFPTGTSTTCERWSFCFAAFFTQPINICFFHKKSESVICANRIQKSGKNIFEKALLKPQKATAAIKPNSKRRFTPACRFYFLSQVHFLENLISKSELLKRDLRWAHRDLKRLKCVDVELCQEGYATGTPFGNHQRTHMWLVLKNIVKILTVFFFNFWLV